MATPRKTAQRKTTVRRSASKPPAAEEVEAALDVLDTRADEWTDPLVDEDQQPIPEDLQFVTSGTAPAEVTDADYLRFTVDGQDLTAVRPDPAMWTILLGSFSSAATAADRAQAILGFVDHTLDEASKVYVRSRLLDRSDNFDVDFLAGIVNKLITHWAPQPNRAARRQAARAAR